MTEIIDFTIYATSEEAFKKAWVKAGIFEDTEGYVFRQPYDGCVELSCLQGHPGTIPKEAEQMIPGWHCNARITGSLAEAMTVDLTQTDNNGVFLPLMERTWASYVFELFEIKDVDPVSGFPYEAITGSQDVKYGSSTDLKSPSIVRQ